MGGLAKAKPDAHVSSLHTCLIFFTHMSVPGYISPAVPHHELVAHPRSGLETGEGLSPDTYLIVDSKMIKYYLGNENIKIKRVSWEIQWLTGNGPDNELFTPSPIFSLLPLLWPSYAG